MCRVRSGEQGAGKPRVGGVLTKRVGMSLESEEICKLVHLKILS